MRQAIFVKLLFFVLLTTGWSGPLSGAEPSETTLADKILQSAGITRGLCVQLGAGDGKLTAALGKHPDLLVQGWESDPALAAAARQRIEMQRQYGRVTIVAGQYALLPYADSLVNLIVAPGFGSSDAGLPDRLREVVRVLAPGGVALLGGWSDADSLQQSITKLAAAGIADVKSVEIDGRWLRLVKPQPTGVDEWTHPNHNAGGNRVSQDTLAGPPTQLRWMDGPPWETEADGPGAVLSSGGRLFYMFNDVPREKSRRSWPTLYARDAYNGLLVWKRPVTGFVSLCFVAAGQHIYTVLEHKGHLVALNRDTGETAVEYKEAGYPDWVVFHRGSLYTSAGSRYARRLMCLDPETGKVKWRSELSIRPSGALPNFVVSDDQGYYLDWEKRTLGCIRLATGEIEWQQDISKFLTGLKWRYGLCSHGHGKLVVGEGMSGQGIHAFSEADGSHQWSRQYRLVYSGRPQRHKGSTYDGGFFIDGLYWTHVGTPADQKGSTRGALAWEGLDPDSGTVKQRFPYAEGVQVGDSCHRAQATVNYFMGGHTRFVSTKTGKYVPRSYGIHNSCRFGMLPANGLTYTWSQYTDSYVRGVMGLTPPTASAGREIAAEQRLVKGSAYGMDRERVSAGRHPWPCFGADAARSTSSQSGTSAKQPTERWQVDLGSDVTPTVIAGGLAVVAQPEDYRVVAFDADTGKVVWKFLAGGRIAAPPTLHAGLCLFGCADGSAYCLDASSGQLVWRFRAARTDRLVVVRGRLESPWPVDGGVLLEGGLACFAAGRHGTLDGGVIVYAVRPETGELVWTRSETRTPVVSLLASNGTSLSLGGKTSFAVETGKAASRPDFADAVHRSDQINLTQRIGTKNNDNRMQPQLSVHAAAVVRDGDTILVAGRAGEQPPVLRWAKRRNGVQIGPEIIRNGEPSGDHYLWAFSLADGQLRWSQKLDAHPLFDSLAVANGKIYLTTADHRLHCFE